jgi:hypothetical protein
MKRAAIVQSFGIVGSYDFRVFQEVLGRPRYLLAEAIDSDPLERSLDPVEPSPPAPSP